MAWLVTRAAYTKNQEVEIPALNVMLDDLGLTPQGGAHGPATRLADQLRRIKSTYLVLTTQKKKQTPEGLAHMRLNQRLFISSADTEVTWGTGRTARHSTTLFVFSVEYFSYLLKNLVPVPAGLYRDLKPLHQDLLTFLSLNSFNKVVETVEYPLVDLMTQFGYSKNNKMRLFQDIQAFSLRLIEEFGDRFEFRLHADRFTFLTGRPLVDVKKPLYVK